MTEYSLEVMGHIDPALVEEIELVQPQKRRRTARFRAAAAAACACLALVGTGFAAVSLLGGGFSRIEPVDDWDTHSVIPEITDTYHGAKLWADFSPLPLSDFPQSLLDLAAEHPGESPRVNVCGLADLREVTGFDWLLGITHDQLAPAGFFAYIGSTYDQGQLTALGYYMDYLGRGDDPSLQARLAVTVYTEAFAAYSPETWVGISVPEDHTFGQEEYVTANGLSVLLTTVHCPNPSEMYASTYYKASFMLDAASYSITIQSVEHPESALEVLKELLEDFHS